MKIFRLFALLFIGLMWLPSATGQQLTFAGVTFQRAFYQDEPPLLMAGYLRPGETMENRSSLIVVRNFTEIEDPRLASNNLLAELKNRFPDVQFRISVKQDDSEVMLDFLNWDSQNGAAVFGVHRFLKVDELPGIVEYQFSLQFPANSPEELMSRQSLRNEWIKEMIGAKFEHNFEE